MFFDIFFSINLGYFPELAGSLVTGSSKVRYTQEKKCALETVVSYTHRKWSPSKQQFVFIKFSLDIVFTYFASFLKELNPTKPPKAYLIYAGLEPEEFIALFPQWDCEQVHQDARNSQIMVG